MKSSSVVLKIYFYLSRSMSILSHRFLFRDKLPLLFVLKATFHPTHYSQAAIDKIVSIRTFHVTLQKRTRSKVLDWNNIKVSSSYTFNHLGWMEQIHGSNVCQCKSFLYWVRLSWQAWQLKTFTNAILSAINTTNILRYQLWDLLAQTK